jgi:hypothetical protein
VSSGVAASLCLVLLACEPATITDARTQLSRGEERVTQLTVPLVNDSLTVAEFLPASDTATVNGLVGIKFDPDSVNVDVGNKLQFNSINLTGVSIDAPTGTFAAGGTFAVPPTSYNILSGEPRITAIDTIVVESGTLTITTQNRLPATMNYTITLNGFKSAGGVTLSQSSTVPPSPNDGTYSTGSVTFNLANVTITPATVSGSLTGSVTVPAGTNSAWASSAFLQNGAGNIVVRSLKGSLNPVQTPELVFSVENSQELPKSAVDFGDFQNAAQAATLNNATASLTIVNPSQAPIVVSSFQLGAVQVNSSGQLVRDGSNNLVYEKTTGGTPIILSVADPGQATLTIARNSTKNVSLAAASLVDRVSHLLLGNSRVALVATGTVSVGDGASSRIARTDFVKMRFQLNVGLDITIPLNGVTFSRTEIAEGINMDSVDAANVSNRVQLAKATAHVRNSTPFGLVVQIALAKDSVPANVDVFTLPNRVTLDSVVLRPPTVNASGIVVTPTSDSVSVSMTGTNARVLFGRKFTAAIRIRLLPGTGGNGRGALRPQDRVFVAAKAELDIKSGGSQ